jgi:hypothetical protein
MSFLSLLILAIGALVCVGVVVAVVLVIMLVVKKK